MYHGIHPGVQAIIQLRPGANVILFLFFFTYKMAKKAKVIVPVRPFDPSLIFVSKTRSLYELTQVS